MSHYVKQLFKCLAQCNKYLLLHLLKIISCVSAMCNRFVLVSGTVIDLRESRFPGSQTWLSRPLQSQLCFVRTFHTEAVLYGTVFKALYWKWIRKVQKYDFLKSV